MSNSEIEKLLEEIEMKGAQHEALIELGNDLRMLTEADQTLSLEKIHAYVSAQEHHSPELMIAHAELCEVMGRKNTLATEQYLGWGLDAVTNAIKHILRRP